LLENRVCGGCGFLIEITSASCDDDDDEQELEKLDED